MDSTQIDASFALAFDMETTGLDANLDVPLEVGMKIIDKEGYAFAGRRWLIWEGGMDFQSGLFRGRDNEYVNKMHTENGLWYDVAGASSLESVTRAKADQQMCEWLDEEGIPHAKLPMLGNSIGSLDRPFSLVHFPFFNAKLNYRNIDISTLKEICKAHNPELYQELLPIIGSKADATHRVMEDIDACLVEYRAYIKHFLVTSLRSL